MHHSLNNNLWDRKRSLLKISNQVAAREFARILLRGITPRDEVAARGIKSPSRKSAANTNVNARGNGSEKNTTSKNSDRKRSRK
jgi:hypothetical protein